MERINIDTLPETNVDWYADGERANAVVLNRPIKQVAGIVNTLIDAVNGQSVGTGEWSATEVSQEEAEAGTETTARKWTSQRVRQAVAAWWAAEGEALAADLDATSAGDASAKAGEALASANAAADYAAVSSASAALANDWATKTSSEVVPGQGFGAKKYALDAEQSAINAETSFQSGVNAAQALVDGFRTYRTVSTSLPSGVPRQGEEWIVVQ